MAQVVCSCSRAAVLCAAVATGGRHSAQGELRVCGHLCVPGGDGLERQRPEHPLRLSLWRQDRRQELQSQGRLERSTGEDLGRGALGPRAFLGWTCSC